MIHTEEMFVEGEVKLLAVVQRLNPETSTWREEGQVGGVKTDTFETVARKYLGMYRANNPSVPEEHSRVVRRTITIFDEPMEW